MIELAKKEIESKQNLDAKKIKDKDKMQNLIMLTHLEKFRKGS